MAGNTINDKSGVQRNEVLMPGMKAHTTEGPVKNPVLHRGGQPDSDKQKQYQQSSGTAHGIGASGAPIGQQSHYGEGGKAMLGGDCKCERQGGTCTCRQGSTQEGGCQCGMSGGVCTCAAKPGEANLGGSF